MVFEQLIINDTQRAFAEIEQFLTFQLAEEEYAIDILRVKEIKGWSRITPIPNSAPFMRGVFNLRGEIVPVIDLRLRFDMSFKPYSKNTVVIVLRVGEQIQRTVGIIVDAVSDARNIKKGMIKAAPPMGTGIDTTFVDGLVDIDGKMVTVLSIDGLLSIESMG